MGVKVSAAFPLRAFFKRFRAFALAVPALTAMNFVASQALPSPAIAIAVAPAPAPDARSLQDWLMRMHEAAKNRSYVGTFVVSAGGNMSSAKIWHVCEGAEQAERVDILSGTPRSIFRHNDLVVTLLPEHKLARSEKRESLGLFSGLFEAADSRIGDFYNISRVGSGRIAGVEADILLLSPRDRLRFGYRVWTERKNGLVVKLQTLNTDGRVLEQAAFSELQLDAPVSMDKLIQSMGRLEGYRVEKPLLVKTTASAEGWLLKTPVAGFNSMSCYKRPATGAAMTGAAPLQWIFSDGLASVSIFIEPLDRQRHTQESNLSLGATQTMTRQLDAYWITLVGEVPMTTLRLFASVLERSK